MIPLNSLNNKFKIDTNSEYLSAAVLLFGLLIFCNVAFINSSGWAKLFWSLIGYAGLLLVYWRASMTLSEVGLSRQKLLSGLKYGAASVLVIFLVMFTAYLINPELFKDERYNQSLGSALLAIVIFLPLKTVIFEEIAFRGIIPALVMRFKSQRVATVLASIAFGLWHVSTSVGIGGYSVGSLSLPGYLVIAGVVLATSFAGVIFCELRWRSGSLIAPLIAHWAINASALLFASISWS